MLGARLKETAFMLTRDRVRLYADIYRPKVVEMRHVTSLLLACQHFLAHEVQATYLYQDQKE